MESEGSYYDRLVQAGYLSGRPAVGKILHLQLEFGTAGKIQILTLNINCLIQVIVMFIL